jgi:hypothetical protein
MMYDPLTSTYSFSCPNRREAQVPLSAFRVIERLPGAAHPAVYRIQFVCWCGGEHAGLIAHDDLDWAHLGTTSDLTFRNLMTSHDDPLATELADICAVHIGAGEWPWSFFCFLEGSPRPVTPSAIALIAPGERSFGVAVQCPACSSVSVNLVTREHIDVPFHNDARVGVVPHVFERDKLRALADFRVELESAHFDERRLDLEI